MLPNLLETDGFNQLVRGRYGYVLCNKNDIYIGQAMLRYGEYGEQEAELFKQFCQPGDVVIDVGANIGTHTLVFARAVGPTGRVIAFEPQRVIFQTLCANMALNSITHVECFHAAVGAKAGFVQVPEIRYDKEMNFGGFNVRNFSRGAKIPLVSLDGCVQPTNLRLIKVDVEGMEIDVLQGAAKLIEQFRPWLYLENDSPERSPVVLRQIFAMGYRAYWHCPFLYNPKNFVGNTYNAYPNVVSGNIVCHHRESQVCIEGPREITDPDEPPPGRRQP